jgi:succinate dehydrogenase/fumarate reductase cytochrome b subunit
MASGKPSEDDSERTFSDGVCGHAEPTGGCVTTIIERTPAGRTTVVKTVLIYLAFTTAWVYGFANGRHDLPGVVVLAFFLLPLFVHFLLGFALAKQEACALLAYAPVLALVGPGLSTSLFVPLAMLAVFPGAPLVLLGIFIRLRMEPREVEETWF